MSVCSFWSFFAVGRAVLVLLGPSSYTIATIFHSYVATRYYRAVEVFVMFGHYGPAVSRSGMWAKTAISHGADVFLTLVSPSHFLVFPPHPHSTQMDMWSLGCIMAELLTGRVLFMADNRASSGVSLPQPFLAPPLPLALSYYTDPASENCKLPCP